SGVFSAGNGPAMRSPVIGAYAGDRLALMTELVTASTEITHGDPKARRGAMIAAWLAARAAAGDGIIVDDCQERLAPFVEGDSELEGLLAGVVASVRAGATAPEFCREQGWRNGVSGYIYHSMAVVLHIVLRHPHQLEDGLGEAIACGGDTDTVAAILGGIIGAGVGREGIQKKWLSRLRDWPRSVSWLRYLARELAFVELAGTARSAPGVPLLGVLARNILFMVWVLAHGFRRMLPPYG
ncbi:MAG: ADP-ribosylglycohydrolase family protein, partial [Gammaproteobacteria bacterium]|nr:ADP-ribosylglycohydrolase family protein [Gammaproteobacteria bacterium]